MKSGAEKFAIDKLNSGSNLNTALLHEELLTLETAFGVVGKSENPPQPAHTD